VLTSQSVGATTRAWPRPQATNTWRGVCQALGHWGQIRVPSFSPGGGHSFAVFFWQKLQLRVLLPLRKTIGASLAAGPNFVGSGSQVRSKTLSKGVTNVGSCCST